MKVIVTGATGFVGSTVLDVALASPSISEIIALTRKPLTITHPKLRVIIHHDFLKYPSDLMDEFESADGCIWAIGGKAGDFPTLEVARKVTVQYTVAFATEIAKRRASYAASQKKSAPFNFIYCSGRFSVPDPEKQKHLWLMPDTRRLKGEAESGLFKVAKESGDTIRVISLRPGGILPIQKGIMGVAISAFGYLIAVVPVDILAEKFVELVVKGPSSSGQTILENEDILKTDETI